MSRDVRATYRVQLHADFDFDDVAALADYLAALGISHVYCSPYLQARSGSTHGYDVVDHSKLSQDLGGRDGYERMVGALAREGLGHIADIVPNHMAVTDRANRWWWDVLKHGPQSRYAGYFDIDWDAPEARLKQQILLPILEDHYGRVLQSGKISLVREGDEIVVAYGDHRLPTALGSVPDDADLATLSRDADALHQVLDSQHYRLASWRVAGAELNYRRFFAINDLAALRTEHPAVFDDTHALVLELVRGGSLHGLRVDHIDGLRYPAEYLGRLRAAVPDTPVWVEKILAAGERLPRDWPVQGTTGYEFLARAQRVLVAADGEKVMTDIYAELVGPHDIEALEYESKLFVMNTELSADVERLTELMLSVCEQHRDLRDFTRPLVRQAIRETIAAFTVYRTYADARTGELSPTDAQRITDAIAAAKKKRPDIDVELFDFLKDVLLLRHPTSEAHAFAMRFQQSTGPIMAKGVEDTFFYRYNRFIALNEVGGDPRAWGISLGEWHAANERAAQESPETLLATSTHDTKRSEDVRARLLVLAEIPDAWSAAVGRWRDVNRRHFRDGLAQTDVEYSLYQTLVGAWPLSAERAQTYVAKATKEAKLRTSWVAPDTAYDRALADFVATILGDTRFTDDLEAFVEGLIEPGRINSLSQTLLKLTCPGVPDIYQGSELWNLSLVDPDNRRPVDYERRRALLEDVQSLSCVEALARSDEGVPKLFLISRALRLRSERPDAFRGSYEALWGDGDHGEHVIAHRRGTDVIAITQRWPVTRGDGWGDTTMSLPPGEWRDVLSGKPHHGVISLDGLLTAFPVSLLVAER
ncbi:MAG: malto-oligosyltrehalose synthase [Actinomycetota bacterium]|nr:malto-oligosyltrehalose synthase [Actinomycetota bacterium]